jgi:hypothetical protein
MAMADPPTGPAEESVARVFADVLGQAAIGREDDFFGLGGDSLIAVKAAARLRGVFGREVTVRDIFDARRRGLGRRYRHRQDATAEREEARLMDGDTPVWGRTRRGIELDRGPVAEAAERDVAFGWRMASCAQRGKGA